MNICVYCGSKPGSNQHWRFEASELGKRIAMHGHTLVYGGGSLGLMGVLAQSVLDNSGNVIGIIPDVLATKEVMFEHCSELIIVSDMHTRKRTMLERSDAIVVLPGGFGTLDELFEALTWNNLGIHSKQIVLINSDGFYTPLVEMFEHMTTAGFITSHDQSHIFVTTSANDALRHLEQTIQE